MRDAVNRAAQGTTSMTMVCFVVFSDQASFDRFKVQQEAEDKLPGQVSIDSIEDKSDGIFQIDLSGACEDGKSPGAVFVSEMPPLTVGPDEEGGTLWPDAPQQLANHRSHWIVTTAQCECSPANEALILTRFVEAILKTHPTAMGILWNQHGLKVSSENFQNLAAAVQPGELPVALWVDIAVVPGENAPVIALTTGMDNFGLMEIENIGSPEPPEELYARIMGVCEYLMLNGPILNHGDTLGESENERILVVHADSAFGREGKVIHLRYDDGKNSSAATLQTPSQPSALKALMVLLGCLLVIGVLISGTVMGITWVVSNLRSEPEAPAAPWAMAEAEDPKDDTAEQIPVAEAAPSQAPTRAESNSAKTPSADATLAPNIDPPPIRVDAPDPPSSSAPEVPAERSPLLVDADASQNPFLVDSDASVNPLQDNGPTEEKPSDEPAPSAQASVNPFQVDSSAPEKSPAETSPAETPSDPANPFQVDATVESTSERTTPKVGDKVRVEWGNKWWDGEIVAINGEKYQFSYDGWSSNWDEWKTIDQLRWPDETPIKQSP